MHIDKLKHFTGTPPKAWKVPDEVVGSSANSSSALAGSNSAGQGYRESLPAVARDGCTDPSVVGRHIQFSTVEGSHPDVVATPDQSAVQGATPPVGIETPTGVRKGVSSRRRKNFAQPMGMANFVRGDSGEFSAPMGAENSRETRFRQRVQLGLIVLMHNFLCQWVHENSRETCFRQRVRLGLME